MSKTDDQVELLPLGTIVRLEGTERKLMVVGRALAVDLNGDGPELYDYAAVVYPFGLIGDAIVYINNESIIEVVFKGFSDEENEETVVAITAALKTLDIPKAKPGVVTPPDSQDNVW